jgi:hypothetical protein
MDSHGDGPQPTKLTLALTRISPRGWIRHEGARWNFMYNDINVHEASAMEWVELAVTTTLPTCDMKIALKMAMAEGRRSTMGEFVKTSAEIFRN